MITFDEFKKSCTTSFFGSFCKLKDIVIFKDLKDKQNLLKELHKNYLSKPNKLIEKDLLLLNESLEGEKKLFDKFKELNYPLTLLHDIRIELEGNIVQFDFIIITPNAIYPIECKHLLGELEVNKNMDFIRVIKNDVGKTIKRQSINNPVNQLYKNSKLLENTLKENNIITDYPVKSFVVFTDDNSYITKDASKKQISKHTCTLNQLDKYFIELDNSYFEENKSVSKSINTQYKIAEYLYKNNIDLN